MSSLQQMDGEERNPGLHRFRWLGMPLPAVAFLLLSAAIAVVRSHYEVLGIDEYGFGLLGIARNSNFARLVHIQLTRPVSFDPIGYNALIYGVIHYFGTGALAMRLPSITGYLLMQVCLFFFVRRIANESAATAAMALPALMGVVSYSVEARPYAVLLGLSALAMLCWQTAARRERGRTLALVGLAVSLALAVNMQYYAVVLFVPFCAAEAVRTMVRRRVDVPMLGSMAAALGGLVLVVPFAKALAMFQVHHGHGKVADFHFVTHVYFWLMIGYADLSEGRQHMIGLCSGLILIALAVAFVWSRRWIGLRLPEAEAVFLLVLSAFPVLAYLLALTVTHFVEARYILPTMIGLCALAGVLLLPVFQHRMVGGAVLVVLFAAIAINGVVHIRAGREIARERMASLTISPETQHGMEMHPGQPIYVSNHFVFEFVQYYSPSADMRSRITLAYLDPKDYTTTGVGADVNEQMANMQADGVPRVASYESVDKPGTERLFLLYHASWDWTDQRLAASHAQIKPLGRFFGGDLVLVHFP
jgi:hypothetical protein